MERRVMYKNYFEHRQSMRLRQRGVVLLIALIVLVAMSLAAIGLMRSVDTSNVIAGNLGFKRGTTPEASVASEAAASNLLSGALSPLGATDADVIAQTYFSWIQPTDADGVPTILKNASSFDLTYSAVNAANKTTDANSLNTTRYVIERLCNAAGASSASNCAPSAPAPTGGGLPNDPNQSGGSPTPFQPLYRITVRVDGPRNTVSFTQVVVRIS
jgi:type IV pilus assembly protein PilX